MEQYIAGVKRSRKSKMKKRDDEWELMKTEVAKELGLWDKVESLGWSGLSSVDSGKIGGVLARRRKMTKSLDTENKNQE